MATDTTVNNLIINKLTKAQYYDIENPSETELYLVPDEIDNIPTENSVNPVKSGGVYSALAGKQNTISGGASTITSTNLTANKALISNVSGKVAVSDVTSTELGYLSGATSNIQTQLNTKIETVKVNGTTLTPDANKAVDVTVPTALSGLTDDSTHRLVTDTEKAAWNGKAEVFIYDIDISTMPANGHLIIDDTDVPFNAINAAFTAGKVVYVKITNSTYNPYILSLVSNYGGYYSFEYTTVDFAAVANIYPTWEEVFVSEFTNYSKPSGGIPKTDLASAVQTSLGKADTAMQAYIYDIDASNLDGNGEKIVQSSTPYTAIHTAYQAGKTIYVRLTNNSSYPLILNMVSTDGYIEEGYEFTAMVQNGDATFTAHVDIASTEYYIECHQKFFLEDEEDPVFTASAAHGISSSDISNWNSKTSNVGTITGITMNGASKGTSGVVDLGTVITDISGKQDAITSSSKLSADLISDGTTNKTVTAAEKSTWSGKQDALTSGTTIKTVNGESVLGSGGITSCLVYSLDASGLTNGQKTISGSTAYDTIHAAYQGGKTVYVRLHNFDSSLNMPEIILPLVSKDTTLAPYTFVINLTTTLGSFYAGVFVSSTGTRIEYNPTKTLPNVTSADNGKILMVVSGQWSAVNPTTIYTGTGTPDNSQGNNGDIYLQTN